MINWYTLTIGIWIGIALCFGVNWFFRHWAVKRFLKKYREKAQVASDMKDQKLADMALANAMMRVGSKKRRKHKRQIAKRRRRK